MDRFRRVLAHLLSTFDPIRPLLTGTIGLLRRDARRILVMLVLCALVVTAVREVANYWADQWLSGRLPQFDQELEFCKTARKFRNDITHGLCQATVFAFMRDLNLHVSIGDAAKLSAAAIATIILYLWTSARMASRLNASPGRMAAAMMRRESVYACLAAAAILLTPPLFFYVVKIAHRIFHGLWAIGPFYKAPGDILQGSLSVAWFLITAPFVLPAVPLALITGRGSPLADAARLGWDRYLAFAALAAATAVPFIGLAVVANWSARATVIYFLASRLDLGTRFSQALFHMGLTTLGLIAVVAIAAAFTVAVGRRTQDAR